MILRYSPEARDDLKQIKKYISDNLQNFIAAKHIVSEITKSCSHLKEHPRIGAELSKKTGRNTSLRYIVKGNYFVFYRIEKDSISVIRILNGRTNYLQVLFNSDN